MFRAVQIKVKQAIGQDPWLSFPALPPTYLAGAPTALEDQVETRFWDIVKDSDSPDVLKTYVERYPKGKYSNVAFALIQQRTQEQQAMAALREAEEKREEEERRAAEASRLEAARQHADREAKEARRLEALRKAEQAQWTEQLQQAANEARKARDEARQAEERSRLAQREMEDARAVADAARQAQKDSAAAEEQLRVRLQDVEQSKEIFEAAKAAYQNALTHAVEEQRKSATETGEQLRTAREAAEKARQAVAIAELQRKSALEEAESARSALDQARAAQAQTGPRVASLVADVPQMNSPLNSGPKLSTVKPEDVPRQLQKELKRVGCLVETTDETWSASAKDGLARFIRYTKVALHADDPTAEALDIVSAQRVRICPLECALGFRAVDDKCQPVPKAPVTSPTKPSRQKAGNCRLETKDECRQRLGLRSRSGGGGGRNGSGSGDGSGSGRCRGQFRQVICN